MNIETVDMTTPLNVEMLKQLKETLAAINEQAGYEDCAPATPETIAHSAAREKSATAVMNAITCFCTPMMRIEEPMDNPTDDMRRMYFAKLQAKGMRAIWEGKPKEFNPYPEDSNEYYEWLSGWAVGATMTLKDSKK